MKITHFRNPSSPGASRDVRRASTAAISAVALAMAASAMAAVDLRITEIWPGSSGGDLTADWFEISNFGSTAWTAAGGPPLYYDDDSFAAGSAVQISGLTSIEPGESVVVVIGTAGSATSFQTTWQGSIDL